MDVRISNGTPRLAVESRRARQTPPNTSGFERALRGGAHILLSGAATVTRAVGLPALSAAISRSQSDSNLIGPSSGASAISGLPSAAQLQQSIQYGQLDEDIQLLAMQDQIQRHSRQIALVSNVLKSQHDTAKSAIGNMRA